MDEETGEPDEETGGHDEGAGSSGQASGVDLTAYTRGAWKGSDVNQAEIDWLYRSRRIPEEVFCRIPGKELEPAPEPCEIVVFAAHFERGFGLPASDFFRRFLDFYELQPHHLLANAIFYLSSYVSFMEGFVGLSATVETFARFYNLQVNSVQDKKLPKPKPVVQCGACILTPRQGSPFYKFSGLESCRAWQQTFFYVRNSGSSDFINLPAYVPGEPSRANWRFNPKEGHVETNRIVRYMKKLNDTTDICSDDIVRAFVSRRVLPLQRRAHKISQMSGRKDPTRITTFGLSRSDVVLKAKQICRTEMPADWKWGLQPFSRRHPPTSQQNFPRILAEEPESFTPKRLFLDDEDPDPFVPGNKYKMGSTHSRRPASADQNPQVLERVTPLTAEVRDPLVHRTRKTPPSEAGASTEPVPKRQKISSTGPPRKKRKEIPIGSGPALELTRSASGMKPEAPKDTSETQRPPQQSPAHSGAGKAHSPRGDVSSGSAAPKRRHHRAEEDFFSPPEIEDIGVGNTGAGSEPSGRSEPLVPLVPKKTRQTATASPSRASSTSARSPSPTKGAAAGKPPSAPCQSSRKGIEVSAQLGRIVELNRGNANLGGLQRYVDKWNLADLTDATLGVGKDKKLVIDSRGPRSTVQHLGRLKHAVKEFDNAWHDANNNVLGVLDSRKQLFEELLWEHRDLTEAFTALQLSHSQCQAEKEELSLQHQRDLQAQQNETAKLKDQLVEAGLQHAGALKEAIAAGETKVEEAWKQFADTEEQLRWEFEEERKLRQQEQERNDELLAVQVSFDQMVKDVDDKALKFFPDSQVRAEATVAKARIEDSVPDANAPWTTKDHLAALYSRISHMRIVDRHLSQLPDAAIKALKCLWPKEPVPDDVSSIADRLLDTGKRLSEWRHSAARAGADTALRFVCSWYESLDLSTLSTMRGNAPTDTDPAKTAARRDRAYRIACYASTSTFIPPPEDIEEEYTDDEEEGEEAGDGKAEAELEAHEEPAADAPEPAPEVSPRFRNLL
ncbi:hypothetical protein ACQ4PT_009790 [Festuca glaucescens]